MRSSLPPKFFFAKNTHARGFRACCRAGLDIEQAKEAFMHESPTFGSPVLESMDYWFVAYFLANGGKLIDVQPGSFVRFLLDNHTGEAEGALRQYINGTAMVPARQFASQIKHLRKVMHEVQEGGEWAPAA
jgi:hypothetical protein